MKNTFKVETPNGMRLRLRRAPDATSTVISTYRSGTIVAATGKRHCNWIEVEVPDGQIGYMWAGYLVVA